MSAQTFAQWKSYYPEGKSNKKNAVEKDIEKDNFKYNNYLFGALKAKSLENFEEALKQFQKCIKLDEKQALPFYEHFHFRQKMVKGLRDVSQLSISVFQG